MEGCSLAALEGLGPGASKLADIAFRTDFMRGTQPSDDDNHYSWWGRGLWQRGRRGSIRTVSEVREVVEEKVVDEGDGRSHNKAGGSRTRWLGRNG